MSNIAVLLRMPREHTTSEFSLISVGFRQYFFFNVFTFSYKKKFSYICLFIGDCFDNVNVNFLSLAQKMIHVLKNLHVIFPNKQLSSKKKAIDIVVEVQVSFSLHSIKGVTI